MNKNDWKNVSGDYYDWKKTQKPERPYIHNYSKTLTMKLFCSIPDNRGNSIVACKFDEVLEIIKKIDVITRGIDKIIYLVGWQFQGHDDKYPSWSQVNEDLKREEDDTSFDSLKWLMNEAFNYNTTVSLHINMTDAYKDSPLWDTYIENDLISKNEDGSLLKIGTWNHKDSYQVCYKNEWESGYAVKRIDDLLEMLPIKKAGTVHIDAFFARESKGHDISLDEEQLYRRKIIRYWRDKGIDVTSEFIYREKGIDDLIGLVPMVWHINQNILDYLERPATLLTGGRINRDLKDYDEKLGILFGESIHGEGLLINESDLTVIKPNWENDFIEAFCLEVIPWYFLNQLERLQVKGVVPNRLAYYNNEVVVKENEKQIVCRDMVIKEDTNIFMETYWTTNKEIIAYSVEGYKNKQWRLPESWKSVEEVSVSKITGDGLISLINRVPIRDRLLTLSLEVKEGVLIEPVKE
ncbi:endo-alpha-N-acetylgalactosaminidase family protein [Vallitalea guaymasensis]|uniref:Endo-alpha-N-acetylgalactosaminidase domain-containing protein n=1 Tax=Vallitalea guaymasensis TaxID=1185412 RepID=A0A8J8SEH5_9FIRM|nr:endo-alpha-N-acetylgalactosaminidase family protein [Vallitalea guaymasensis]QUH31570.1 hypothetical protein HYG85_22625 [Vallitalea guaymasensis]